MNLVLDFTVSLSDDCNTVNFCDTTCSYNPLYPAICCDGYGVLDNPTTLDINYSRFNWICPDGNVMTNLDLGWKRGSKASIVVEITNASTGILIVDFDGIIIGASIAVTDKNTTASLLAEVINANSQVTGWSCILTPVDVNAQFSDPYITIINNNFGTVYNNKLVTVTTSGDVFVNLPLGDYTINGTEDTNCFCVTPSEISIAAGANSIACNTFPDGVHTITYILYDINDNEVSRITKKFLFLCHLINGIKELITSMADGTCACSHDEVDERIMKLRMMIEQAQAEFDECLYSCAQDTVDKANKLFERICTGC
jgi:hypothetical protein